MYRPRNYHLTRIGLRDYATHLIVRLLWGQMYICQLYYDLQTTITKFGLEIHEIAPICPEC